MGANGFFSPFEAKSQSNDATSPFMNINPIYLQEYEPEFIFPEGANTKRGRFELAFSQIGMSVLAGATYGGVKGLLTGYKETLSQKLTPSARKTQILNYITRQGAASGNALGVISLIYSGMGVLLQYTRGVDDELNTITSATLTGAIYKCTGGIRKCAIGSAFGFSVSALYCMWMSRDRIKAMRK